VNDTHPLAFLSRRLGLNIFLVCIPIAWASHYDGWSPGRTFARTYLSNFFFFWLSSQIVLSVSFMAIISLEKLFDWGGEQLAMYCGPDLGDLIVVTLNKSVPTYQHISLDYQLLLTTIRDLQRRRSYPRHHSPYSMQVRVHNVLSVRVL
jgi:hypothetical protein